MPLWTTRRQDASRQGAQEDELAALKLEYDRVAHERDRLRDARAFFARQLGPLPALAGGAILAGTLTENVADWGTATAGALFVLMSAVSYLLSNRRPYRSIRENEERQAIERRCCLMEKRLASPARWYRDELDLEERVYKQLGTELRFERWGVFIVQALFVLIVAVLLLAYAPPPG